MGDKNDSHDLEENGSSPPPKDRRLFSIVIENFSFLWFTVSMNTGILSILMHQNPYQFSGLGIISTIMFVFNIVLFTIFAIILILRMVLFPHRFWQDLTTNVVELPMIGCVTIAWTTLVAQVALTVSNASWGSHAFTLVAYVMWWGGTAVMLCTAMLVLVIVSKFSVIQSDQLAPALVIPFVGTATDAVVGGLLVNNSAEMSPRLAVPVIVVSYLLLGIGLFVAIFIFSAYLIRLINTGLPPIEQAPTLFLLVGPPGQSAAASLLLGTAARMYFPGYAKGTILTNAGGTDFAADGVWFALMLLGLASFFTAFALYYIVEGVFKRAHKYSMVWWGVIFPVATMNTAWISLAEAMDSPAFRALSTIWLLTLLLAYIVNWIFTLLHLFKGGVLGGVTFSNAAAQQMVSVDRKAK